MSALLTQKADVSDVSRAVAEVIKAVDNKSEIDELKKQISSRACKSDMNT